MGVSTLASEFDRVLSQLNISKTQVTNNPLYQSIVQLTNASKGVGSDFSAFTTSINAQIAALITSVNNLGAITLVSVDTSGGPVTVVLATAVSGFTVIKDSSGNAAGNPITLSGTVDGVVNPVINTNFGLKQVYGTGPFFTW